MAQLFYIARPYARAAFLCAEEKNHIPAWKNFLEAAVVVAEDPAVLRLLHNPTVASHQLLSLFEEVLSKTLHAEQRQFLSLLTVHKRLVVLPEILLLFRLYEAEATKHSQVRVITATAANEMFKQRLSEALRKRLNRQIDLHHEVDPDILGGAIIHMGDRVMDGSIRGELNRLLEFSLK